MEIAGTDGVSSPVKLLLVEDLENDAVTPKQSKSVQP